MLAGTADGLLQGSPTGRAQPLEASQLELDRHAVLAGGLDRQGAMRRDRARRLFSGWGFACGRARIVVRARPQPRRIGIQPEDELRSAGGDLSGDPIAKALRRRGAQPRVAVSCDRSLVVCVFRAT